MKCNTQKDIPIKQGKVSTPNLSRNSKRKQKLTLKTLAKGSNLSGGERHYVKDDKGRETPDRKAGESIKVGGFDNGTLLLLDDMGIKIPDYDSAIGYCCKDGLRLGEIQYLKPVKDEAERSTKEIDRTEPETVRPKAPRLSEKVDRASSRVAGARSKSRNVLDPIHGWNSSTKAKGLFRQSNGELEGTTLDEAIQNKPFQTPRGQENKPRGQYHTIPMEEYGRLPTDPVRLRHGDTMVEDFDSRAHPTGYESNQLEYAIDMDNQVVLVRRISKHYGINTDGKKIRLMHK